MVLQNIKLLFNFIKHYLSICIYRRSIMLGLGITWWYKMINKKIRCCKKQLYSAALLRLAYIYTCSLNSISLDVWNIVNYAKRFVQEMSQRMNKKKIISWEHEIIMDLMLMLITLECFGYTFGRSRWIAIYWSPISVSARWKLELLL